MRILIYIPVLLALNCFAQTSKIDSIRTQLETLNTRPKTFENDTTRINTLNALALELRYNNTDSSIYLSSLALKLSEEIQWKKGIGNSNHNLGKFNRHKGNHPTALSHFFKALSIWEQLEDEEANSGHQLIRSKMSTLGNIGNLYADQGDYVNALKNYFKILKIQRELNDKESIAKTLGNIGIVYYQQGNESQDRGDTVASVENYDNAIKRLYEALNISKELGSKNLVAIWLGNLGNVYVEKEKTVKEEEEKEELLEKALNHYKEALDVKVQLGDQNGIAIWHGNIGLLFIQMKRFAEAEEYLLKALAIDTAIGSLTGSMYRYLALTSLYETTGRFKLAYINHKEYGAVKDSLFNEDKSKDIGRLEVKHEMEMAQQEKMRLLKEIQLKRQKKEQRRNNLQYSVIFIIIVLLSLGLLVIGKINIPVRLAEGAIFFTFLLFFEFTLVLLDPYIEQYSSGAPAIKLAFNAVLAGLIFPLHSFFESKLKSRITN